MARATLFLALTEFARQRFIAAGLPADRIGANPTSWTIPVRG
jgi:hypothetical protein